MIITTDSNGNIVIGYNPASISYATNAANNTAPPATPAITTPKYAYNQVAPVFSYKPSQQTQQQINSANQQFNMPLARGWQGYNTPRMINPFTSASNQTNNATSLFNSPLQVTAPKVAGLLGS